jgi:tetratricopeptide (TPR) repeat protein
MSDNPRIEDLRRRVQKDPASIAFAQLAEELRRSGSLQEAVDVSLAGLALHPSYLSARVTLGRALLELDRLDQAQTELERVLAGAPENLAARRGLGEIFNRRGHSDEALMHYRLALALAPNVAVLSRQLQRQPIEAPCVEASIPAPTSPKAVALADSPAIPSLDEDVASSGMEPPDPARDQSHRTVVALEGWLDAIHVARANRRA